MIIDEFPPIELNAAFHVFLFRARETLLSGKRKKEIRLVMFNVRF